MFLRSVGATAAGMAVGLRASHARASDLWLVYDGFRARGKPLLVATEKREMERAVLSQLAARIGAGRDRELAVRMMLVEFILTDAVEIKLLTKDGVNGPSSLALIDGEPPRVIKAASLDRVLPLPGFKQFLRDAVPLTTDWLEGRVALAQQHHADEVKEVRRRIAAGEPTGHYGVSVPAVVALEALRRKGADRDRLIAGLLNPVEPKPKPSPKREMSDDCGLGMLLVSPLGARFADVFTKPDDET